MIERRRARSITGGADRLISAQFCGAQFAAERDSVGSVGWDITQTECATAENLAHRQSPAKLDAKSLE
jgi:hypothetical protein